MHTDLIKTYNEIIYTPFAKGQPFCSCLNMLSSHSGNQITKRQFVGSITGTIICPADCNEKQTNKQTSSLFGK